MNPLIKPPPILYGIGITDENDDDNPDFQMFINSSTPKKPEEMKDKINKMLEYVEIMSVKNRDNNAILHQMMQSMEERINKRIDNVRNEILGKIYIDDDDVVAMAMMTMSYNNIYFLYTL